MKITLNSLRRVIREQIARNYHTLDNDPYSYMDFPGIEVATYPSGLGGGWYAQVTCSFDEKLSTPLRIFRSEYDADSFARKEADKMNRERMSRNILTGTPDDKIY